MSTLILIPVLTAFAILALVAAVYNLRYRNATINDRLQRMVNADEALVTGEAAKLDDSIFDSTVPGWLQPLAALGFLLPTQMVSETLKWELAQAGYRHLEARRIFVGIRVLCTVTFALATLLIGLSRHIRSDQLLLIAVAATALGYLGPMMYVRARQSKRQMDITLSLPDGLDLLVICVEAGQGLNAALMKVGKEIGYSSPALSEDLMIVNNEMRAGVSRTQALRNLSLRTGSDDVRSLVAVMIQSDRFGTSVAHALRIHSDSLRTKRRQRAEERAAKVGVKMVFPLALCLIPALYVVCLGPVIIKILRMLP